MRLSLALVLSMALAQAAQQPESTVRHRQVRRNDTGEPQRIKKLPREDTKDDAGKKDKKSKDVESGQRKDKKSKEAETKPESKKDSKKNAPAVVESNKSKRKEEKKVEESEKSKRKAEKKAKEEVTAEKPKKEKRSGDQKELKNKLKKNEQVEVKQGVFTIDLGDILGGSSSNSLESQGVASDSQKDHESKREQKKKERENEGSETVEVTIVEQTPTEEIVTIEVVDEVNTSPTVTVEGGRHKHVGHGRKKGGRGKRGGARGQKLQGNASGKSGKEEQEIIPFRKHHNRGGRNKTKTRGSGKLRNIGGNKKETKNKTKVKTTQRMGARGSAVYAGKSAKL